jgi:hypothetical protein
MRARQSCAHAGKPPGRRRVPGTWNLSCATRRLAKVSATGCLDARAFPSWRAVLFPRVARSGVVLAVGSGCWSCFAIFFMALLLEQFLMFFYLEMLFFLLLLASDGHGEFSDLRGSNHRV